MVGAIWANRSPTRSGDPSGRRRRVLVPNSPADLEARERVGPFYGQVISVGLVGGRNRSAANDLLTVQFGSEALREPIFNSLAGSLSTPPSVWPASAGGITPASMNSALNPESAHEALCRPVFIGRTPDHS